MMKKSLFALFALLTVSCTASFEKNVYGEGNVTSVTVEVFADTIASPSVQLVDARTPQEFNEGNIQGSINIDVMTGHFGEDAIKLLDKERPVAVYCRSGNRSKNAAKMLSMMGYDVIELDKGYKAWSEAH